MQRLILLLCACFALVPHAHAQAPVNPRTDSLGDPLPPGAIARLGTLRFKHNATNQENQFLFGGGSISSQIQKAVMSPDGKKIATIAAPLSGLWLWDAVTGKPIPGPWNDNDRLRLNNAVAFSPDSAIMASTGIDRRGGPATAGIILWDLATAKELRVIGNQVDAAPVKTAQAQTLAFADGGKTLVLVGLAGVRWVDVATGKMLRTWQPFPDNLKAKDALPKIAANNYRYVLSPQGSHLAVQERLSSGKGGKGVKAKIESEAIGFDLATGKVRWRTKGGATNMLMHFAFSADEKRVAIAVGPDAVELRDTVSGKLIDKPALDAKAHGTGSIGALAMSPDGSTVAIAGRDGHVVLWKPTDGSAQETDASLRTIVTRMTQNPNAGPGALSFSPDGKTLVVGAESDVQLYDVGTLKEVTPWDGHRSWVDHVAFTADGQRLLTGCGQTGFPAGGEVLTWDAVTWKRLQISSTRVLPWPNIGLPSFEHNYFVGKDGDDRYRLYDFADGRLLGRFVAPPKQLANTSSFFSPGGKFFLLSSTDGQGKGVYRLFAVPSCKLLCELPTMPDFYGDPLRPPMVFSGDDRLVALFARNDGQIHVYETATGKLRHRLGTPRSAEEQKIDFDFFDSPGSLALSNDGKLLASYNPIENMVRVWDMTTGKERLRLPPDPERHERFELAWSPDGKVLAVGDRKIQLWEAASGKLRREFSGHEGDIRCLAFSPDGRLLASGSTDTTVLVWDVWGR
jgi:WD40 repeat protein